ncbi:MAG: RseA family anti-sigma factor [Succinivibrio sp.]|jgi:negative regulator of sigma E activity|nr:RseA family anti-sigma factor [Succinivibrio sp.]
MQAIKDSVSKEEILSANLDGQCLDEMGKISAEDREHLENWSLMGAALRDELPSRTDLDFAAKVMARVQAPELADQAKVEQRKARLISFRKVALVLGETVAAASVCMLTVFGYQTWNAGDSSLSDPVSSAVMGPVNGVNLASYQNRGGSGAISLDGSAEQLPDGQQVRELSAREQREFAQKRDAEAGRINTYLKGYVLDSAAN